MGVSYLCLFASQAGRAADPEIAEVIQQAVAIVPNIRPDGMRERALQLTAVMQAKAGDANGALLTIEGIRSQDRKWEALASWAHARAQKGDAEAALRIAASIGDAGLQAEALADIAEAQAQEGDRRGLTGTIQLALRQAAGIQREPREMPPWLPLR